MLKTLTQKGHSTSVSKFSEALARAINLPEKEVERITLGALLHDVGKIGIPESVLKKEGPLSDEEWVIMKQHPVIGYEKVLQPNPNLRDLIPIVKYHHKKELMAKVIRRDFQTVISRLRRKLLQLRILIMH